MFTHISEKVVCQQYSLIAAYHLISVNAIPVSSGRSNLDVTSKTYSSVLFK